MSVCKFANLATILFCFLPKETSQAAKEVHKNSSKTHVNTSSRVPTGSKRVFAPMQQGEPTRVTRQRTKELTIAMSPELQQVETIGPTAATPTTPQDQDDTSD